MNIKIDTTNKIITIEDSLVSLSEFVSEIEKILPNWKEYKLNGLKTDLQFVPYPAYPTYPIAPLYSPWDTFTICEVTQTN